MERKQIVSYIILFALLFTMVVGCSGSTTNTSKPTGAPTVQQSNVVPSTTEQSTPSTTLPSGNTPSQSTWNKTAGTTTGYDWADMNYEQKESLVSGVIQSWKNSGKISEVGSSWYISNLNDFYGDSATNGTDVAKAMSMIAVSGNIVHSSTNSSSYTSSPSSSSLSGVFWCMGKNDTCNNKTHNATDLYCSSCDRNDDNIED